MAVIELSGREFGAFLAERTEGGLGDVIVVKGIPPHGTPGLDFQPCIVVGEESGAWSDVVAHRDEDILAIVATAARAPLASTALTVLLRGAEGRSTHEGLLAESATYSALQGGPEFLHWRTTTPRRKRSPVATAAVRVERQGNGLTIELHRPERHNALGVEMRDGLLDALAIATADPSLTVTLRGAGPSFCAGGDLDEFGTTPDPTSGHLIRLALSIGEVLEPLAHRTTVHLHGSCIGSGIELAAFGGRVVATASTTIALPEVGLGLIPGAGGTVSLPRRIGRHRTALLALTRHPITASTALDWGLVDHVVD